MMLLWLKLGGLLLLLSSLVGLACDHIAVVWARCVEIVRGWLADGAGSRVGTPDGGL